MEKLNYKISSRTAILLGRENVSKADGAIIELIKNSYDADASKCYLIFDDKKDRIFIIDNGTGMNKDLIDNNWLTIGTDNKKSNYKSNKNRVRSGEKGIGRLALDRLGNKYEMFTKMKKEKLFHIETTWSDFEKEALNLNDIDIILNNYECNLNDILINEELEDYGIDLNEQGTILKITQLRDVWDSKNINNIYKMLGYLLPPTEQKEFQIYCLDSYENKLIKIENIESDEYDYKINAHFDGSNIKVDLYRNEFDMNIFPNKVFAEKEFLNYPYRKEDFNKKKFEYVFSLSELLNTKDEEKIKKAKEIGKFTFNYIFMKILNPSDEKNSFYYKNISSNRSMWIKENNGIKIYRDGFMVRPYGDNTSAESHDWLGLDARKANSPAAISHKGMGWKVRNTQSQGTLTISRISNDKILDKSSREGIIENEYFSILKEILKSIISIFEKDRAYIASSLKKINERNNENEKIKNESIKIAQEILSKDNQNTIDTKESNKKLAQAINIYKDEREELISEIKLLRSLATNGLITTSIVHDLKTINATLVKRIDDLKKSISNKNTMLIERNFDSMTRADEFLKSWISILISQAKSDKRKRKKELILTVIKDTLKTLEPLLLKKKIDVEVKCHNTNISKKIFVSDIESILYNLIINSIESFEQSVNKNRKITISLLDDAENIIVKYEDNGDGLGNKFSNPYDIFDFGVTSKYNKDGEKEGTGLGMYIVSSTINEYNGEYKLLEINNKFEFEFTIPK